MSKKELKAIEAILKPFEVRTVKFKDGKFDGLKPRETRFLKSICEMYREVRRGMDIFKSPQQKKKDGGSSSFFGISRETKDGILFGSSGRWVNFVKEGIEEINKHSWYPTNQEIYEDMENIFKIVFEYNAGTTKNSFKAFINIETDSDGFGYQTLFKIELNEEILEYF